MPHGSWFSKASARHALETLQLAQTALQALTPAGVSLYQSSSASLAHRARRHHPRVLSEPTSGTPICVSK